MKLIVQPPLGRRHCHFAEWGEGKGGKKMPPFVKGGFWDALQTAHLVPSQMSVAEVETKESSGLTAEGVFYFVKLLVFCSSVTQPEDVFHRYNQIFF